ncbi:MAG: hypothetical protein D6706_01740 [Chloroflexi bacterium]|nr:MAG: hypothetical protein D6706_01740 [Chloroflexota bacterium]
MMKLSARQFGIGVVLLALLARLPGLNGRSLWYDEAFSILYARNLPAVITQGAVSIENGAAADVHSLFYYGLLNGWMRLLGDTPIGARSFSVFLGVLTVVLIWRWLSWLFAEETGRMTAVLVALSPFHVYYSQETRMYALLATTAVATAWLFTRAWASGRWRDWLLVSVSGALTLYAHNLGSMIIISLVIWTGWQWLKGNGRMYWRKWLAAHIFMLLLFAPWLTVLFTQLGHIRQAYWITRPDLTSLLQTILIFHFGYDNQALPVWLVPFALFLSFLLLAFLLLAAWQARRQSARQETIPDAVSLLVCLAIVPVGLTFLVSRFVPVYVVRALLPSALAYYALLAVVLAAAKMPRGIRWLLWGGTAVVALLSLFNHYTYQAFPRPPFAQATADLQAELATGDLVMHSNKLTFLPAQYYAPDLPQVFIVDPPGSGSDTLAEATQRALGIKAKAIENVETAVDSHSRVWFVIFQQAIEEFAEQGKPHPHLAWLRAHYTETAVRQYNDLYIFQFIANEN